MKYKVDELILQLAGGADMARVLLEMGITMTHAEQLLRGKHARRVLAANRRLARIHSQLVAHRYSSFAVARLCEVTAGGNPDQRLRGALALLGVAGLKQLQRRLRGRVKGKDEAALPESVTAEDANLLEGLARLMEERGREVSG